ncbi:PD-(D/E)XK nuclease family protein [Burkholderia vietnamiensis]|uniref:PD-(D/E)XK nuclease family protein n=1 Tax=Burkholderia vietnamiensis TaxID=60552 RepID=UPI001D144608|nr:PD-(D/E)XK nuclease family protein [Burkholderia vietnamiensis]UEC01646.1 PD-(D/E)XK nuclease family protein [Burkholderia vietnamiensis]
MVDLGFATLGGLLLLALLWWWAKSNGSAERASRPRALARAELVYLERTFRISEPFQLVAKVDRAYRLPRGSLVLVELKTRRQSRPYLSDIIQLSAQRLAIEGQTGEAVESYAFVSIPAAGRRGGFRSHRVQLLDAETIVRIHARREAILAGLDAPTYALSERACVGCALRSKCDRVGRGGR